MGALPKTAVLPHRRRRLSHPSSRSQSSGDASKGIRVGSIRAVSISVEKPILWRPQEIAIHPDHLTCFNLSREANPLATSFLFGQPLKIEAFQSQSRSQSSG